MEPQLRRKDRAIPLTEAKRILQAGEYGVLSTASADGKPYGVPISYAYIEDSIYFHGAIEGQKITNLRNNNRISFCVVGKTQVLPSKFATNYESVIIRGEVLEITGDEKRQGLIFLLEKYAPGYIGKGLQYIKTTEGKTRVFKILVHSITGKARRR